MAHRFVLSSAQEGVSRQRRDPVLLPTRLPDLLHLEVQSGIDALLLQLSDLVRTQTRDVDFAARPLRAADRAGSIARVPAQC